MQLPRRSFLRAGSAVAAFGSLARLRAAGNEDRIRVGLVGVGGRGSRHLRTVLSFPFVDVVAVCDNVTGGRELLSGAVYHLTQYLAVETELLGMVSGDFALGAVPRGVDIAGFGHLPEEAEVVHDDLL